MSTTHIATAKPRAHRRVPACVQDTEEIFLAGEKVPAGMYDQINGRRRVRFEREDILPATCDGRVAIYVRASKGHPRHH